MQEFKFTHAQASFLSNIQKHHKHICCYGGTGSGKTIMFLSMLIMRCALYPKSKHLIVRGSTGSTKTTIVQDFDKLSQYNIFEMNPWKIDRTTFTISFQNGSYIECIGSDKDQHFRKVQGTRYSTMYLNECSKLQVKFLFGHEGIMGRLTQGKVVISEYEANLMPEGSYEYGLINGVECYYYELAKQYYYDFNPPSKAHWTYKYFIQGIHPKTLTKIPNLGVYYIGRINPVDNPYSAEGLYEQMQEQGDAALKSMYYGDFQDIGGKFISRDHFNTYDDASDIDFQKIFITTDFAKSNNTKSDYNVICVWGLSEKNELYLLDIERFKAISIEELSRLRRIYKYWQNGFNNGGAGVTGIYIEKPNNQDIISVLQKEYGSLIKTDLPRSSNKFSRFSAIANYMEKGNVYIPSNDLSIRNINVSSWLETFLTELESFSENEADYEHDDIVDNFIDACHVAITKKPAFDYSQMKWL